MATVTVQEFRGVLQAFGSTAPVPLLSEVKVTAVNAAAAATIVLQKETSIVRVSASAAARMSGRAAIAGGNPGIPVPFGDGYVQPADFGVTGGATLHLVAGA